MPEHEHKPHTPEWAQRERHSDIAGIGENFQEFWDAARRGFVEFGRGALQSPRPAGRPNSGEYTG